MTDKKLGVEPVPHEWGPSDLGHGEAMCRWCRGTNRELAAMQSLGHCDIRAQYLRASQNPETLVAKWELTLDATLREVLKSMIGGNMNYAHFGLGTMAVHIVINPLPKCEAFKETVRKFQEGDGTH